MDSYELPFGRRYGSRAMVALFSAQRKYSTWRRLWIALAEAQRELGIKIDGRQIEAMRAVCDEIDFDAVRRYERETRHEVSAHIRAFGDAAPAARPIIHLGATSAFVIDNGDLVQMRAGLELIRNRIVVILRLLKQIAVDNATVPALAYTHLQPAQPTTVGKRVALWAQSLIDDLRTIEFHLHSMRLRGAKGATGTQAAYKQLLKDYKAVCALDEMIATKMGFVRSISISSQTYDRKLDSAIIASLGAIAQSAHKCTNDIRLLQANGELEEGFDETQVGSSAMAYKRNPIICERIASLAKFLMALPAAAAMVAATQWLERSLDDSAARRLYIPQAFLAADAILVLWQALLTNLTIRPETIAARLERQLPFLATETILMAATQHGGDRQELHERLRIHSMETIRRQRAGDEDADLLARVAADESFGLTRAQIDALLEPAELIGFCPQQVAKFVHEEIDPVLERHRHIADMPIELEV